MLLRGLSDLFEVTVPAEVIHIDAVAASPTSDFSSGEKSFGILLRFPKTLEFPTTVLEKTRGVARSEFETQFKRYFLRHASFLLEMV